MSLWDFCQANFKVEKAIQHPIQADSTGDAAASQIVQESHNQSWRDDPLMQGVPKDAYVLFPSIRHDPDLMGYGVPSNQLPDDLKIFGYWGHTLHVAANGNAWPIPQVDNPPLPDHMLFYLKYNLAGCIKAQKEWERQCK